MVLKRNLDHNISFIKCNKERLPKYGLVQTWLLLFPKTEELVNVGSIMFFIKKNRPDMYKLFIEHPKGIPWIRQAINDLKKMYK